MRYVFKRHQNMTYVFERTLNNEEMHIPLNDMML